MHQLQIALARADSEALARSIAEETVADLEKEKTIKELEINDLLTNISVKDTTLSMHREAETEINKKLTAKISDYDEMVQLNTKLQEDLLQNKTDRAEIDKLHTKLKNEVLLKQTAVNKLAEIMNRKDITNSGKSKTKVSSVDLRKKEKESRRLQQELTQEREKYNQLLNTYHDVQSQLNEESHVSIQ